MEISRFHELAPASEPEAVIKLLNDVFCDVRANVFFQRAYYSSADTKNYLEVPSVDGFY